MNIQSTVTSSFVILAISTLAIAADSPQQYKDALRAYQSKNYQEARRLFDALDSGYRTAQAQLYRAESYAATGNNRAAADIILNALRILGTPETQPRDAANLYVSLIKQLSAIPDPGRCATLATPLHTFHRRFGLHDAWHGFMIARTLRDARAYPDALACIAPFSRDLSPSDPMRDGLLTIHAELLNLADEPDRALEFIALQRERKQVLPQPASNHLVPLLYSAGMKELGNETINRSRGNLLLQTAKAITPMRKDFIGSFRDPSLLNFYAEVCGDETVAAPDVVTLNFTTFFYRELDAEWTDEAGVTRRIRNTINDDAIARYEREFRIFSRIMHHYTGGTLIIRNRCVPVPATVRKIVKSTWTPHAPGTAGQKSIAVSMADPLSAEPHIAPTLWQYRNTTDCFVHVFPMNGLPYAAIHAGPQFTYVPGRLSGPSRTAILLHSDAALRHIALVHEFFHAVEYAYNPPRTSRETPILISHVFQDSYRKLWPSWYHGEGELIYYREAYRRLIMPRGFQPIQYSRITDPTTMEQITDALKLLQP